MIESVKEAQENHPCLDLNDKSSSSSDAEWDLDGEKDERKKGKKSRERKGVPAVGQIWSWDQREKDGFQKGRRVLLMEQLRRNQSH